MSSAAIALGAGIAGLGLGFAAAVWRGDWSAPVPAPAPRVEPAHVQSLLHAGVLPWVGASRSPPRTAPLPPAAPASPELSPGTPVMPGGGPTDDPLPDDDTSPGIGAPVEAESYFDARDRAAGHSARSR
jgi:hypothetical protein